MSLFEFIVALYVVIAGLGITLLVRSIGQMLESRDHISFYWVHSCWLGFIFLMHVNSWFALWEYRDNSSWTIGQFLLLISVPTLLYLASHISVPEIAERKSERYDMRSYYFERHRILLGLLAVALLFIVLCEYLLGPHELQTARNWARLLGLCVLLAGIVSKDPRVHTGITVVILGIVVWGLGFIGHPIE